MVFTLWPGCRRYGCFLRYSDQVDHSSIDQDFSGVLEINGNPVPDDGLHLTNTPIRSGGMTNAHAWYDKMHFGGFPRAFVL